MNTEIIDLCKDMVAIPSINPQDRGEIEGDFGEAQVAEYVGGWFRRQGLDCQLQTVRPGRINVLSVAEGADSSRTVLLCAHLDTVNVQGMTVEPFDPQIRDGKLYGRGACDDKGPLATMLVAFRDRVQAGNLPCNLALLGSCGEEYNMIGAKYYVEQSGSQLCGAIMGEPTNLEVITAHKGVARLEVITKGKSAHSSMPQYGVNAIYSMADALKIIEARAAGLKDRPAHQRLGWETFSVTVIEGGQQINIIPDRCRISIDWRILPGRTPQMCRDELAGVLQEKLGDQIKVELFDASFAPMESDNNSPFIQALLKAGQSVTDKCRLTVAGYATDASVMVNLNIPTPVFGPGDPTKAHSSDEYIEIKQLDLGLQAYQKFLAELE